ncbi:hypothetical protein MWU76_08025 [Gelidibacter sp. F2691]|nr:hypothetical protein [Gelidibacter sp. F2691]
MKHLIIIIVSFITGVASAHFDSRELTLEKAPVTLFNTMCRGEQHVDLNFEDSNKNL